MMMFVLTIHNELYVMTGHFMEITAMKNAYNEKETLFTKQKVRANI